MQQEFSHIPSSHYHLRLRATLLPTLTVYSSCNMIAIFILSALSLFAPVISPFGPLSGLVPSIPAPIIIAVIYPIILFVIEHLHLEVDPTVEALATANATIQTLLHQSKLLATRLFSAESSLKHAQSHIAELETQKTALESSNHTLHHRCTELDSTLIAIVNERNSAIATWTQDNVHIQSRNAELESLYISLSNDKAALECWNVDLLAHVGDLQTGTSALAKENARLREEARSLKEVVDEVTQQKLLLERSKRIFEDDVRDLKLANAALDKEKKDLIEKASGLEGRLEYKDQEVKEVFTRALDIEKKNEDLRHVIIQLEVTIVNKDATIKHLSTRTQETEQDNKDLRHTITNLEVTIANKDATIKALTANTVTDDQVELQLKNTFAMLDDLLATAASVDVDSDVYPPVFADSDSDDELTTSTLCTISDITSFDADDDEFICTPFPRRRTPSIFGRRFGRRALQHDLRESVLIKEAVHGDEAAIKGKAQLE